MEGSRRYTAPPPPLFMIAKAPVKNCPNTNKKRNNVFMKPIFRTDFITEIYYTPISDNILQIIAETNAANEIVTQHSENQARSEQDNQSRKQSNSHRGRMFCCEVWGNHQREYLTDGNQATP